MQDAWSLLGVSRQASQKEIKAAYRRAALQFHPDLCDDPARRAAAEAHFKDLSAAYQRLTRGGAAGGARAASYAGSAAEWAARTRAPPRFSNGVLAALLAVPLILTGVHLSHSLDRMAGEAWRPDGSFWNPPENPFLRENLKPKMHSRMWGSYFTGRGVAPEEPAPPPPQGPRHAQA